MHDHFDGVLSSVKHEASEYGYFHVPYVHVLVQANLQEESVMRKVTVRLKSRCDENDQWGYVETYQVVTQLGTAKELYCVNHCKKT